MIYGSKPSDVPRIPFDRDWYGGDLATELDELVLCDDDRREQLQQIQRRHERQWRQQRKLSTSNESELSIKEQQQYQQQQRQQQEQEQERKQQEREQQRERRQLGASGDFTAVTNTYPLPMLVERRVYGPAHMRKEVIVWERSNSRQYNKDLDSSSAHIIGGRMREDPTTTTAMVTRDRIQFIETLEYDDDDADVLDSEISSQRPLPNWIGPLSKVNNYTEIESKDVIDDTLSVREQLSDRLAISVDDDYSKKTNCFLEQQRGRRNDVQSRDIGLRREAALRDFAHIRFGTVVEDEDHSEILGDINGKSTKTSTSLACIQTRRTSALLRSMIPKMVGRNINLVKTRTKKIIEGYITNSPSRNQDDISEMLFEAIDERDIQMMRHALDLGAKLDFQRDGKNAFQTVFTKLCKVNEGIKETKYDRVYESIGDILFRRGANVNSLDCPHECYGWGAIHYASAYGSLRTLEWLLKCRPTIDLKTSLGQTPLMLSCERGRFEIAYRLIQQKANLREEDDNKKTLLHYAAVSGNMNLLSFLVRCGCAADKLKRCRDGETPISILLACNNGKFRNCAEYLQKVAIPTEKMTPYIETLPDAKRYSRAKKEPRKKGIGYGRRKKRVQSSGNQKLNWPRI